MDTNYKRTVAGSVGAGLGAIFNASGRTYYILEHKTNSKYHYVGEAQKIIVDQIELGRDSSCQVRFDESFETVSRKHAAIVKDGDNWKLIPLSTTNSTLVNGQPIQSDRILNSGDEIKLSSQGPVMGFIIPQGQQSMVKSIGLTERMNLFRKQALRPYKTAIWILFVVLILAVAGLVTWNILQSQNYEKRLNDMLEEQAAITEQISDKDAQIEELTEKLNNSDSRARMTSAEIRKAQETLRSYQQEKEELMQKQEDMASSISDLTNKMDEKEKIEEQTRIEQEEEIAKQEALKFANLKDCYNAVYYIKMDNVSIYDKNNNEIIRFSTDNFVGGTGFLLENGRFVTARRVVEPWLYYKGVIGKDSKNIEWRFEDLQAAQKYIECKIVANFTAYAPNGSNFKFSNTDMRGDNSFETKESYYVVESYRINRVLAKLYKRHVVDIKIFNKSTKYDWASMAKKDQLTSVNGLMYDNAYSMNPKTNTEVFILGYPLGIGMNHSESVNPTQSPNTINVSSLNDVGVIELSSSRYQDGNDGAPILVNRDGNWTVIGILSHTDGSDRDVAVPISYTK